MQTGCSAAHTQHQSSRTVSPSKIILFRLEHLAYIQRGNKNTVSVFTYSSYIAFEVSSQPARFFFICNLLILGKLVAKFLFQSLHLFCTKTSCCQVKLTASDIIERLCPLHIIYRNIYQNMQILSCHYFNVQQPQLYV